MTSLSASLWARKPDAQIALSKALTHFDASYRAAGRSPRTIDWYHERLGHFFRYLEQFLGREPSLVDFRLETFRLFILDRMAGGKYKDHHFRAPSPEPPSRSYIHGFYRAARGLSSWLFRESLVPANVMVGLEVPKLEGRELQPLTPDEEIALLESHSESRPGECRNKAIMMLMLSTGLRMAEVVSLTDEGVNLDEGFLTVWGKGRRQSKPSFSPMMATPSRPGQSTWSSPAPAAAQASDDCILICCATRTVREAPSTESRHSPYSASWDTRSRR